MIEDNSIDCILTDHPWLDIKSNKGGTRAFALYDCFRYTLEDFKEKARVLKDGCFLVEVLPAENENNYEYLYQMKYQKKYCPEENMQKKLDLYIILKLHGKRELL